MAARRAVVGALLRRRLRPDRAELRAAPVHWPRPSVLEAPLTSLYGVGPKLAEAAAEAGIRTVGDLLCASPTATATARSSRWPSWSRETAATVLVEVLGTTPAPVPAKGGPSITSVKVGDDSGSLRATWFNQPWVAPKLVPGAWLLLTGSRDKRGFRVTE